jgi:UTP--glucose-1-phosphate uridylyltransferase
MSVKRCVIAAAGLGTRFLPATKAFPKEMLPILDKPQIQWAVEEAVASGIEQVVMVLAPGKESIIQHFSKSVLLEEVLTARGKTEALAAIRQPETLATFNYVYQNQPLGTADAVLCAQPYLDDEAFACMYPDDISYGEKPILQQLVEAYEEVHAPVLALMRVPKDQISRYGVVTVAESRGRLHRVTDMVEKPLADEAASDLAMMGRYILTPNIFDVIKKLTPGTQGELWLTDAIKGLLPFGEIWGVEFEGELLDTGTPEGWLTTTIRLAKEHPKFAAVLQKELASA